MITKPYTHSMRILKRAEKPNHTGAEFAEARSIASGTTVKELQSIALLSSDRMIRYLAWTNLNLDSGVLEQACKMIRKGDTETMELAANAVRFDKLRPKLAAEYDLKMRGELDATTASSTAPEAKAKAREAPAEPGHILGGFGLPAMP